MRKLHTGSLSLAIALAWFSPVHAKVIYVNAAAAGGDGLTWTTAKKTVQDGLNAAVSGDQVWVVTGTYVQAITLKSGVELYGGFTGNETQLAQRNWVANNTTLDGNASGSVVTAPSGATTGTRIDGFTIRNGKNAGVSCSSASPTISNNIITANKSTGYGGGISCSSSASPVIVNNTIVANSAIHGGGIYCGSSSLGCPVISGNTITGNAATSGCGGGIYNSSPSVTISNNIVAFNSSGLYNSGGTPTLRSNCVYNPEGLNYKGLEAGTGDTSQDPQLLATSCGNVHLKEGSPCIDAGYDQAVQAGWLDMDGQARIQRAHVDIGADEFNGATPAYTIRIVRVAPSGNDANDGASWSSAKRTVQAGIDAAATSGGEIWVSAGTYTQRLSLKMWTHLYGGFAGTESSRDQRNWNTNVTVLDGAKAGTVVTASAPGYCSSTVDGFTIRNGIGTLSGSSRIGGGVYCSSSSPAICNNIITGNTVSAGSPAGGGIYCYSSSPAIFQNTITGNTAASGSSGGITSGGGIFCTSSSPAVFSNSITGNTARTGAGIYCSSSSAPTIYANVISGNNANGGIGSSGTGGGIYSDTSSPFICNNRITGNAANDDGSGGGIYCGSSLNILISPTISDNVISGNSASRGGGIVYYPSYPANALVSNNTITGNTAESGGGFYCNTSSSLTIVNNIIAFNSSGLYSSGGTAVLRNNCVYNPDGANYTNLSAGTGDISIDPQLVASSYDEVHLKPESPCIDTGRDDLVQNDEVDIEGEPRVQGTHVDIGADEFNGTTLEYSPRIVRVSTSGDDANDGSSWASAKRTVQAGIDSAATSGGEVWVAAGTYIERITLKVWVHLYGGFAGTESSRGQRNWRAKQSILDGAAGGRVVVASAAGYRSSTIDGFTVWNGKASSGAGICSMNASPTIANNTLSGNAGGGILCSRGSPAILNNTVWGNTGDGIRCDYSGALVLGNTISGNSAGAGIFSYLSSSQFICNNVIAGNTYSNYGPGIACSSSSPTICNNTIVGNTAGNGRGSIYCQSSSPAIINNIVALNSSGIYVDSSSTGTPVLRNNCVYNPGGFNYSGLSAGTTDISIDPELVSPSYGEIHLRAGSPCVNAGADDVVQPGWTDFDGQVRPQDGHVDIGADEFNGTTPAYTLRIVRVALSGNDANDGASWSSAKRTVQAGIDAAATSGGEVWVARGLYGERITLRTWTHVYGGFAGTESSREQRNWVANPTILDGGGGGSVVTASAPGHFSSTIDGFTIRNGSGTLLSYYRYGGGIYCTSSGPIISNNTITGNTASGTGSYGGGIYCPYAALITHNTITGNISGSVGGGISCSGSAKIIGNRIIGNTAAGLSNSQGGGGIYCSSSATIANNTIAGNTALSGYGGGVYCTDPSAAVIVNNTIVENIANTYGGGIYCYSGSALLSNNIVAFNSSGMASFGTLTLHNNCVFNPAGTNYYRVPVGAGDVSVDPQLIAAHYGEFHLTAGSPCIDAGLDTAVQSGDVDMDGEPRIQGAHVDIGADEFNGTTPTFSPRIVRVSTSGNDANDGSAWSSAKRTVKAGIDAATNADGGEVWVAAGTYAERITLKLWAHVYGGFSGDESDRSDRDFVTHRTILDGSAGGSVVTASYLSYGASTIDGFTLSNGSGTWSAGNTCGGGVFCDSASPMILHNTIAGNTVNGLGGAVYCSNSSAPLISCNKIVSNRAMSGAALYCSSSSPAVVNNVITANSANTGGGLYCVSSSPGISNNTVVQNTANYGGGGGLYLFSSSSPAVSNNIVAFNSSGICTGGSAVTPVLRNNCVYNPSGIDYVSVTPGSSDISVEPGLVAPSYGEIHLRAGSACINAGADDVVQPGWTDTDGQARLQDGHVDIGADEFTGTAPAYTPKVVRVSPLGNDANDGSSWTSTKRTVQAGIDAAAGAGGAQVWVASGTYSERITLKTWTYVYGGFSGTEPNWEQRNWGRNRSILDGGAVGSVVSALAPGYGSSSIDGFTIRNGASGGVYCSWSSPAISNNIITSNSSSSGGGIYCSYSSPAICDNLLVENTATYSGGGIYCNYSSPVVVNNTIARNTAGSGSGGGIYCDYACSPAISNNIVAFNNSGLGRNSSGTPTLRNNCVYNPGGANYTGLSAGTGDISSAPLFLNAEAGDYHLLGNSPCIDAGYNAVVPGGILLDLECYLRLFDDAATPDCQWSSGNCGTSPVVDIGAYEFTPRADLDHNGMVSPADFDRFLLAFGHANGDLSYNSEADFDRDGAVTLVDYQTWLQQYRAALGDLQAPAPLQVLGDFQPDGHVDDLDLEHIVACQSGAGVRQVEQACQDADLDGDTDVDQDDFGMLQRCATGTGGIDLGCKY